MCVSKNEDLPPPKTVPQKKPTRRWFVGMLVAAIFSLSYLLTPLYFIAVFTCLFLRFPSDHASYWLASPLIISALFTEATHSPYLVGLLRPMLDYFDYEEQFECSDEYLKKLAFSGAAQSNNGEGTPAKKFIVACQPHGVISYVGVCAAINVDPDLRSAKTAVASSLLKTPILKNIMGIFGLTDASAANLRKQFQKDGVDGSVVLYVGGIAELFKSSRKEERLYLSKRKGFVKLALREGVDIIPAYMFGNTSVLTVVKTGLLATLSRKLQVSLTYFWGKWMLPIPRDEKLLYARAAPLGLPHIPNPTNEDIDKWHTKYCEEVTRLFDQYKDKLPMYKNKTLFID